MPTIESLLTVAEVIFWLCTGAVFYVYVGYPALIWLSSRLLGTTPTPRSQDYWPTVTVIVAAHNEESVIRQRIENLFLLDYPHDRLEVVIASDGSSDRTCDIVRDANCPLVRLLDFRKNRGKAAVLNDSFMEAKGEIVVLSDANTIMDRDAIRRMVRWFADPRVGVVCGRLLLVDARTGSNADGLYWKYETFLKGCEARLGALLGANGAIYAIRRSVYPMLPNRVAVDDFVIPLLVKVAGSRIEYDADAIAYEETAPEIQAEFARRSRIGAGGFQSLSLLWPLVNPFRGWIALSLVSHKILRWVCPFFLIGALTASITLIGTDAMYGWALCAQMILYSVAAAVYRWPELGSTYRVARLPTMFAAMNLALLAGFFRWAAGRQVGTWARTARTGI